MLRGDRHEVDEHAVDEVVAEALIDAGHDVLAGHAALVVVPELLAQFLERALVPGRAEIARQGNHRDEQREGGSWRRQAHEEPTST